VVSEREVKAEGGNHRVSGHRAGRGRAIILRMINLEGGMAA
jgi:hypothetical protein